MKMMNRFVDIANRYADSEIPIERVFLEATCADADLVVEAMYVIAERRARSGRPVSIDELTSGIPFVDQNSSVLDAAVTICVDGYISQGHSQTAASEILLKSTSSRIIRQSICESLGLTDFINNAVISTTYTSRRLPCFFGNREVESGLRYELRKLLGSGSQGAMYEAIDRCFAEDGQPSLVAIKIAHESKDGERSRLEATRARRIRHKNIAQVHDCGIAQSGESYIAYELIEGLTLDKWLQHRHSPLSPHEACRLVIQLADGIQCAHNNGVVHRDVKPTNILINRDGDPVITDFGISYSPTPDAQRLSYYGARGSLAFMSPEQYQKGNEGTAPSVDVYSLGGILYWLLTGLYPNGETVPDALTRLGSQNEGGPKRDFPPELDSRLVRIVLTALSPDLSDRYTSAAQLGTDLDNYISNRPISWLDTSWIAHSRLFVRRNPLVLILYLITTVAIVTSVSVWKSSQSRIQLELSRSEASLRMQQAEADTALKLEKLNSQVALEQDRVRQLSDRNLMAKNMLVAWSQAADNKGDEVMASANLLFLYTISTCGFLDDAPEMADKILNQRINTAEEYLATLTPENSSPIQRALWHEMLGVWYIDQGNLDGADHLIKASDLVTEYAPEDQIWRSRLEMITDSGG